MNVSELGQLRFGDRPLSEDTLSGLPPQIRREMNATVDFLRNFPPRKRPQVDVLSEDITRMYRRSKDEFVSGVPSSNTSDPIYLSFEGPYLVAASLMEQVNQHEFQDEEERRRWMDIQQGMANLLQLQREAAQGTTQWEERPDRYETNRGTECSVSSTNRDSYLAKITLAPQRERVTLHHAESLKGKPTVDGRINTLGSYLSFSRVYVNTIPREDDYFQLGFTIQRMEWQRDRYSGRATPQRDRTQTLLRVGYDPNNPHALEIFAGTGREFRRDYLKGLFSQLQAPQLIRFIQ